MKKVIAVLSVITLLLLLTACRSQAERGMLKIYVDGGAYADTGAMVAAFTEAYPGIQVDVEVLPQVKTNVDRDYHPSVDTDSLAQREAVLQQHRTALMAGSGDADLYLLTGGMSQYHEMNGGALVQDPYALMGNGVLADLSEVLNGIDPSEYLSGVFEAGQMDGSQYLIPLRVGFSGLGVDMDDAPEFPQTRAAFLQVLKEDYAEELGALGYGMSITSLSYPVVNKAAGVISLYDENYAAAIRDTEEFAALIRQYPLEGNSFWERIRSGTLLSFGSNPLNGFSAAAADLVRENMTANLAYIPFPNEYDGATAEILAFAFAPASSKNQEAAATFLRWMLSEEVQDGTIPVYAMLVGYPVRKGCAEGMLRNSSIAYTLDYVGDTAMESLREFENRVTNAKYSSHYDFELTQAVNRWYGAGTGDLLAALDDTYRDWALYLDE